MPFKKLVRKKTNMQPFYEAILWALSDGKLYRKPKKEDLHGFDFHPAYPWWGTLDPECSKGNLELMRLLWNDHKERVLADWKKAGVPGQPSWAKRFDE